MRRAVLWSIGLVLAAAQANADVRADFEKEVRAAVKTCVARYNRKGATVDEQVAAVRELARLKHPRVVETLAPLLQNGPVSVRIVVARELAGFGQVEGVTRRLVEAFRAPTNAAAEARGARVTILRTLGALKSGRAVSFLHGLLRDKEPFIAKAAIDALGKIRDKSSIDALIKEYQRLEAEYADPKLGSPVIDVIVTDSESAMEEAIDKELEENAEAPRNRREFLVPAFKAALTAITRENQPDQPSWRKWWSKNRASFRVPE